MVEAQGLKKSYGPVQAVEGLDLRVQEGEIYGLLGPNGSGKTTTILMLLGLTEPSAGRVQVAGFNPTREPLKVKRVVGYLPENVGFYDDLTARENLRYIARLNGIPDRDSKKRIEEVLEQVGLSEVADRPVGTYSRGMRQRLGIADVLVKEPRLAILDEPTTGIDPEGASQILDMIVRMRNERGMTILLSSHLLHQVQRVCDRVGIMHRGRLVAEGTVDELSARTSGEGLEFEAQVRGLSPELVAALKGLDGVREVVAQGERLRILAEVDVRSAVARTVLEKGAELLELRQRAFTLEEIYLRYFQG
ncbi:MAG: ABC transporter [Acetothermia bacterium 64_32]|nr:MAG: ABC transporter [Acetothermia bacterium 64_32]HAF70586.1 ABC transporter ATP-binding protein [Candidatus Acetothermia bacterium]